MRFTIHLLFFVLASCLCVPCPAQSDNRVIKVTYTSSPISQHSTTEDRLQRTPTKASWHEFLQGITTYYSLYINLEDRSSLYTLDSTVQVRPIGWENSRTTAALLDTVYFSLKSADNRTYKHEWIMNRTFFSEGRVGDVKWKLLDEQKSINGLSCLKAVSTNYPMLTVWYAKDIPVSNGPSIYQGLPGLVVWAEDYMRTIEIADISYDNNLASFREKYNEKIVLFKKRQKEKGIDSASEPLVIVQKGDLAISSYEFFQKKPYKR